METHAAQPHAGATPRNTATDSSRTVPAVHDEHAQYRHDSHQARGFAPRPAPLAANAAAVAAGADAQFNEWRYQLEYALLSAADVVASLRRAFSPSSTSNTTTSATQASTRRVHVSPRGELVDTTVFGKVSAALPPFISSRLEPGASRAPVANSTANSTDIVARDQQPSSAVANGVCETIPFRVLAAQITTGPNPRTIKDCASPHYWTSAHAVIARAEFEKSLDDAQAHLERLRVRINTAQSRILVTGDLNAGKSTIVNSLLGREMVPDDQEPCTSAFVEVFDAKLNGSKEEVHGIINIENYDPKDPSSYTAFEFRDLRNVVEAAMLEYKQVRIYSANHRGNKASLLHNGSVEISLIDSPGLNLDMVTTTALFSQQEEIDVVVFVVNAENHITMSGEKFLRAVGEEKRYIFIIVNRFDSIRKKERCKAEILKQIERISPNTYAHRDRLVHFVSAKQYQLHEKDLVDGTLGFKFGSYQFVSDDNLDFQVLDALGNAVSESSMTEEARYVVEFERMEHHLHSFILKKRAQSKLEPCRMYLYNLLRDILFVLEYNKVTLEEELDLYRRVRADVEIDRNKLVKEVEETFDKCDALVEDTVVQCGPTVKASLKRFTSNLYDYAGGVQFYGLGDTWHYAGRLQNFLLSRAAYTLRGCVDYVDSELTSALMRSENYYHDVLRENEQTFQHFCSSDSVLGKSDNASLSLSADHDGSLWKDTYTNIITGGSRQEWEDDDHRYVPESSFSRSTSPMREVDFSNLLEGSDELREETKAAVRAELTHLALPGIISTICGLFGFTIFSSMGTVGSAMLKRELRDNILAKPLSNGGIPLSRGGALKIACAAITFAGVCLFNYRLSDYGNKIEAVVIRQVRAYLERVGFVEKPAELLSQVAREKASRGSVRLRADFKGFKDASKMSLVNHDKRVKRAYDSLDFCRSESGKVVSILQKVSELNISVE